MTADAAVRYLNAHEMGGLIRTLTQREDVPEYGCDFTRIKPFDALDLHFVEVFRWFRPRVTRCPPTPDLYLIHNAGKFTRYGRYDYGRAVRHFATLVEKRSNPRASTDQEK